MKFWPFRTEDRAQDGYTNQRESEIVGQAYGNAESSAAQVAVVEFGLNLYSRAFAAARVKPSLAALSPETLAGMARRLLLSGNAVYGVQVDQFGNLALRTAATWDITGGASPETWRYHLDYPGPSRFEKARLPSASVIHVRVNASDSTPWNGVSPLKAAGLSSKAIAMLERRLSEESGSRTGYLFVVPDGADTDQLKADLGILAGGIGLIETTQSGYGQGREYAPKRDWELVRFGANIPSGNLEARRDVAAHILSALGVPSGMLGNSDGTHLRESYRQWLTSGVLPMARLIESELTLKLECEISLDFSTLAAADIASRARAFGVLASNGIDPEEAKQLAGLSEQ